MTDDPKKKKKIKMSPIAENPRYSKGTSGVEPKPKKKVKMSPLANNPMYTGGSKGILSKKMDEGVDPKPNSKYYKITYKTTRPRANQFGTDAAQNRGSGISTDAAKQDVISTTKIKPISEKRYNRIDARSNKKPAPTGTNPRLGEYVNERVEARLKKNLDTKQIKGPSYRSLKDKPDVKMRKFKEIAKADPAKNTSIKPKFSVDSRSYNKLPEEQPKKFDKKVIRLNK
jgi:hypothetical protein